MYLMYLINVYENEKQIYYYQYIYKYSCYFMILTISGLFMLMMLYHTIKV
jgi:hypothetical protein